MFLNIIKGSAAFCTVLGLSACEPAIEVTAPEVQAGYLAGFSQDRVAKSRIVTIRSFTGRNSERAEFAGAECVMLSGEITAQFVTPAKVIVPAFVQKRDLPHRGRPSNLRITCSANGHTGVETYPAADKTVSTATNAGIAGAILTSLVSGAIASSTPWSYPADMAVQVDGVSQ